jgi:capsular polysaccharide transport system permease protein
VALKDEGGGSRREGRSQRKRMKALKAISERNGVAAADDDVDDDAALPDEAATDDPLLKRRLRLLAPTGEAEGGADEQVADNAESRIGGGGTVAEAPLLRSPTVPLVAPGGVPAQKDRGGLPRLFHGPVPTVKRTSWLMWSAVIAIAIPTLIATLYYLFIASDQFSSEGRFAIRTSESTPAAADSSSVMASLGLGASTPTTADSYIVVEYLQSRRLVEDLQARLDLRKIFSSGEADWYARLDPEVSIEKLVSYWNGMTEAYFDSMTGIVQFEAKAFSAADAQRIAAAALESAEKLINGLSKRARDDTVQFAKDDLGRAELRLKFARKAIREFRDRQKQIDPTALAASRLSVVASLESQLATEQATRAMVTSFLNNDAPSVRLMENKIDALRNRIKEERSKLGTTSGAEGGEVMSTVIAEYEELATDREFAETLYKSSLSSLEAARMAAERQMRYVASFVEPKRAEDAQYPERFKNILLVFLATGIAWVIGVLIFYGVRDHTI